MVILNEQNEVLLEIFKTNLALQHGVEGEVLDVSSAEEATALEGGVGEIDSSGTTEEGAFPFLEPDGGTGAGGAAAADRSPSGNGSGPGRI